MDCCNYPEYRAQYCASGYAPYAPLPYSPYAPTYYAPLAHDHYARLAAAAYHYDGYHPPPHAATTNDHLPAVDYGAYTGKEARSRRGQARRELLARTPIHSVPLPSTPPLDCGVSGRSGGYCEPQMWPQYQPRQGNAMGVNGWNGMTTFGGGWMSQGQSCARDHIRHPPEIARTVKGTQVHNPNQVLPPEGRSTPFSIYEKSALPAERARIVSENANTSSQSADFNNASRDNYSEPRRLSPVEKKPPVVPLPAFQQAFGSTEIGRFAEAFSRAEVAMEETSTETFPYDSFSDWDGQTEPVWSSQPATREIKCEESQ